MKNMMPFAIARSGLTFFLLFAFTIGHSATLCALQESSESKISFDRQIRPLLSDRCYACHGPDANTRAADLRLDRQEDAHDVAIVPGSPADSELWLRISSDDPDMQMPPPDSHKATLTREQQDLLKQWIQQGAEYESFWAFRKPESKEPTDAVPIEWRRNPIDTWAWVGMHERGLQPNTEAEPRDLIRRVTLDLTGLPPSNSEIANFLKEWETDGPEVAWTQLVDRLLSSPRYGEHIGRYWLDVVRYADTNGMHKDFYRNHYAYRDWVIRAFNDDLGYDEFLTWQLAGDLLENPTQDQLTATAFHRLHLIIDRGTALPEESFHKNIIDRVTAVGTAFLGLTVQCAQCHDHKYDPISQKDFYSLYAFFNNIDANPETVAFPKNGLQPPFISLADAEQKQQLQQFDEQLSALAAKIKSGKDKLTEWNEQAKKEAAESDEPSELAEQIKRLQTEVQTWERERKKIQNQRAAFDRSVPYAMVMKERAEVNPTFVKVRGQYDIQGDPVTRQTPSFLPPLQPEGEVASRLDLARWLASPEHPLTARVAVNRVWQQLFGVGLVKTSEDFGAQGESPSHPELLDQLAIDFVDNGWKFKSLIRQIVLSKTYRQSSHATTEEYKSDPENRWLSRGSRYRLDAEVLRDQILATSGLLVNRLGGPSVKPPQPPGLWQAVTMINERFVPDTGDDIFRRSVYTYWKRGMPPPQMTILNAPIRDACIARRERTNTPSQALLLLNEPQFMLAAGHLALKTLEQPEGLRVQYAWETVTGKLPDKQESKVVSDLLADLRTVYAENPELVASACKPLKLPDEQDRLEVAAWSVVINTLYNLDITKNRD